jgi:hypothetical protein
MDCPGAASNVFEAAKADLIVKANNKRTTRRIAKDLGADFEIIALNGFVSLVGLNIMGKDPSSKRILPLMLFI